MYCVPIKASSKCYVAQTMRGVTLHVEVYKRSCSSTLSIGNKGMGRYSVAGLVFVVVAHNVAANAILPMCNTPNLPLNGGIKGGTQPLYSLGSVLYYTCNDGYQMQAGFAWTACRLSFKGTYWENNPPTCVRKRMV